MLSSALARALSRTFCWVRLLVLLSQIPNGWFQVFQEFFKDGLKPSQAHGGGCNPSPDRSAVGLVLSQVRRAGLQLHSAAATPGDNPPLSPDSSELCDFLAAVNDPPGGYLTTKTMLAWLKDLRAEAHVDMHWQILEGADWEPLPSPKPPTSPFHCCFKATPSPGPAFTCLSVTQ